MTFKDDLLEKVSAFARESWGHIPNARILPTLADLTLGNSGERLDVTILYADIHRSTEMVDTLLDTRAAEYYKAFLHCAAKILVRYEGTIQAYDGDRVMSVFTGERQETRAAFAALEINFAVREIINPTFASFYGTLHRELKHTVGVDRGTVLVAKAGVRIDSDLVWVGPAANYAAKLNSFKGLDPNYPTRISAEVLLKLENGALYGANGELMWEGPYNDFPTHNHYRTSYMRTIG